MIVRGLYGSSLLQNLMLFSVEGPTGITASADLRLHDSGRIKSCAVSHVSI